MFCHVSSQLATNLHEEQMKSFTLPKNQKNHTLAHLQEQCNVLCTDCNVGDVFEIAWNVHRCVIDIAMAHVRLKLLETHMSDTTLVYNSSCLSIRIKASKKFTSLWTACLLSWNREINCPSVMQRWPCDTSEPEGKVASLRIAAKQNAWTTTWEHMIHQRSWAVQNAYVGFVHNHTFKFLATAKRSLAAAVQSHQTIACSYWKLTLCFDLPLLLAQPAGAFARWNCWNQ